MDTIWKEYRMETIREECRMDTIRKGNSVNTKRRATDWYVRAGVLALGCAALAHAPAQAKEIIHDAEYYILQAQNGQKWAADDKAVDAKT